MAEGGATRMQTAPSSVKEARLSQIEVGRALGRLVYPGIPALRITPTAIVQPLALCGHAIVRRLQQRGGLGTVARGTDAGEW